MTVQIMEVAPPPRLTELSARLQAAVRRDSAWFVSHVRAARPGEPLPYDPRLGMTELEYREFLALSDSMRLRVAGEATLRVSAIPRGWRIDADSSLPDLRAIEIDTVTGEVHTPMGTAGSATRITASERQRTTGPWDGLQWRREELSSLPVSGTSVTFALGRLRDSGRVLLYYDARRVSNGALTGRATRILTFAAPN